MNTQPYGKHQLYKGYYKMDKGGEIKLPQECQWQVRKYMGNSEFGEDCEGEIALLLHEDYGDGGGFWSVISFLTEAEAKALAEQLVDAFSNTKRLNIDWSRN